MSHAVEVADLRVAFGATVALDGASLVVDFGEVVSLLGPNGAGKTTLVETLLGFRAPTSGAVRLHGLDPRRDRAEVVARTGALLQRGGVWAPMTPRAVIALTARYYDAPRAPAELIERLGLEACASTPWRRLSGGEQQRTLLALALVGRPKVLALDEPTTAVDPEGRATIREILAAERERGAALLVTTHELVEAERVSDRVVVLARGRVVASGTLDEIAGAPAMVVEASAPVDPAGLAARLGAPVVAEGATLRCALEATPERVAVVTGFLRESGVTLVALRTRATLEERYLELVGGAP